MITYVPVCQCVCLPVWAQHVPGSSSFIFLLWLLFEVFFSLLVLSVFFYRLNFLFIDVDVDVGVGGACVCVSVRLSNSIIFSFVMEINFILPFHCCLPFSFPEKFFIFVCLFCAQCWGVLFYFIFLFGLFRHPKLHTHTGTHSGFFGLILECDFGRKKTFSLPLIFSGLKKKTIASYLSLLGIFLLLFFVFEILNYPIIHPSTWPSFRLELIKVLLRLGSVSLTKFVELVTTSTKPFGLF